MAVTIGLAHETDFDGWRRAARNLRLRGIRPELVRWSVAGDLFAAPEEPDDAGGEGAAPFTVPAAFVDLAKDVVLNRSPERFALLYRLLWRLEETPALMSLHSDPDVRAAEEMAKAVSRASHKMKAFVRFRLVEAGPPEAYVAWFEPAHRVVERTAPFFARRFSNMIWSILTPDACAHWDGEALSFTPGADRSMAPDGDAQEALWRTYYASIFNPARLKVKAMQAEMPKRYWRNLPEAALIPQMIQQASARTDTMVQAMPSEPRRKVKTLPTRAPDAVVEPGETPAAPSLQAVADLVQACRRCDLWRDATQGVAGEGPPQAAIMLVGEQPGDQEDLAGRPFVGPAGEVLNRALAEAGVPRDQLYVTNAVKHFKHEPRGKRRLHKTPDRGEVQACRWWLDNERRLVRPRVIVALGGTAAGAVFGRPMPILKSRGHTFQLEDQAQGVVTVHPSYLLRIPDRAAKEEGFRYFVEDLRLAASTAGL
jgi:uracil-DNA glycosylase